MQERPDAESMAVPYATARRWECSSRTDSLTSLMKTVCAVRTATARDTTGACTTHKHPEVTVANIKSQKKRILTNAKAAERNRAVRSELKTRVKTATASTGSDDDSSVRLAMSKIDRAVAKGVMHKNTAARKKSRLMQKINAGS